MASSKMLSTILLTNSLILLGSLCSAAPLSTLRPRNSCKFPGDVPRDFECEPVAVDQTLSKLEYNIYRSSDIEATSDYITYVNTVLSDVAELYSSFLDGKSLYTSVYVVKEVGDAANVAQGQSITEHERCYIQMETGTGPSAQSELSFKATIAHEMYHCVQNAVRPDATTAGEIQASQWWVDGTAEFFANYFYPDVNSEVQNINGYDPARAPIEEENAYPAAIIFQYLLNIGWTPVQIHTWMTKQTYVGNLAAEMTRIYADGELSNAWPGFASRFVDGKISFKGGQLVKLFHPVVAKVFPVPDGPLSDNLISVPPFRINAYTTIFDSDKAVSMTFTPSEPGDVKTILQYRKGRSGAFSIAKPGEKIELQNTENSACPTDPSEFWQFIMTSTNDPSHNTIHRDGQSHATLSFSVTKPARRRRQESCEEPEKPEEPEVPEGSEGLDKCLVGSWNLDSNSMRTFLAERMASAEGISVSNLNFVGNSALSIDDGFHSSMTFTDMVMSWDMVTQGLAAHTDMFLSGSVDGNLLAVEGQSSMFTWALGVKASGSGRTITRIPALDMVIPLDLPFADNYSSQMLVKYACVGNTLEMTGMVDGVYAWAYTWLRV
ncbi:hypothetical protein BKA66DRAFT_545079 [Pyrenochaeta sp. MPI-SDFR-AT-0127]|nr:hypothetical protein BKA66DRAFT_545079 [Pyrenochaeta sp. MPI-SDFR-AT-0127]